MRILLLVVLYVVLRRFCMAKSTRARSSARLERTPDKREVGSSSLPGPTISGSVPRFFNGFGALAQLGEHLLCKQGVIGSIPISSTIYLVAMFTWWPCTGDCRRL